MSANKKSGVTSPPKEFAWYKLDMTFSQVCEYIYMYIHIYIINVIWIGQKFGILRCSFLMACAREVAVIRDREATLALELQECQAGNVRTVVGMVAIEMDSNGSIRNSWILIIIIDVPFPISPWDFQAKRIAGWEWGSSSTISTLMRNRCWESGSLWRTRKHTSM